MPSQSDLSDRARAAVQRYASDPDAFAREILGVELWSRQAEIARAVVDHRRTACKSGHKIGKSTTAAVLAIWWLLTRPRSRVVILAPADHLIKNSLWPELRRIFRNSKAPLGPEPNLDPRTGWRLADGRAAFATCPAKGESVAGIGGPNQLVIADEASGIDDDLWPSIFGTLAGEGCRLLLLGNPVRQSGIFFDAFHGARDQWFTLSVSSLETPNFFGQRIPGLATPEWADECLAQWGAESPLYLTRVLGEFPRASVNAVIGLTDVEQAQARYTRQTKQDMPVGALTIGVDVARFGDDRSCICARRGPKVLALDPYAGEDNVAMAGHVIQAVRRWRAPTERTIVRIDATGVGSGVVDHLVRVTGLHNMTVVPVHFGARPKDPTKFVRARDEAWWALREWIQLADSQLPKDDELAAELVSPVYSFDPRGRILVEPKDATRKKLRRSPDKADALALSVYQPHYLTEARLNYIPSVEPTIW